MKSGDVNSSELIEKVKMTVDRRDNVWLQLYVCPEFRKLGKCGKKEESELCIYAHPDRENKNLLILNSGLNGEIVVCCFENVFRTCVWKNCKFYHPPDHLKNVVKTNGKNNLRLRNELKQSLGIENKPVEQSRVAGVATSGPGIPYYVVPAPQYPLHLYKHGLPYNNATPVMGQPVSAVQNIEPLAAVQYRDPTVHIKEQTLHYREEEREEGPPGEANPKKRTRTPESPVLHLTPPKRPAQPYHQPVYDPSRRFVVQDSATGQWVYPTLDNMVNLSMVYQNPGTLLPNYPYLLNYTSGSGNVDYGTVPQFNQQFQIPTLTTNRNLM